MNEPKYVTGREPDREIPADQIGKLEEAPEPHADHSRASSGGPEAAGRVSPFWVKCWSCQKFLTRPLAPPSEQAYTCPNCGAVNMI